ncbi:MAG: hypothetical protein H6595_01130 [Flavobacteriales bacterium]|nr:hypothetical protein [Flavobacteriales bacterium]MCB9166061.1 hypothetical protein [Flavobacteriales bacterium]
MSDPLEILSILATSMVKFAMSPFLSYKMGYSFGETLLFTSIGGTVGVLFFYRISGWLMRRARVARLHRTIAESHGVRKRRKAFTRTNRFIVRVKRGHGLEGLAAITPILISIPLGAVLAAKYFDHDRRTIPTMISAVLIWSVVLSSLWTVVK